YKIGPFLALFILSSLPARSVECDAQPRDPWVLGTPISRPQDMRQPFPVRLDRSLVGRGRGKVSPPVGWSLRGRFVDLLQEEPIDARDELAGDVAAHGQGLRPRQGWAVFLGGERPGAEGQ